MSTSATIISLADHRRSKEAAPKATTSATKLDDEIAAFMKYLGPPLSDAMLALPFVSKEVQESGWPVSLWDPKSLDTGSFEECEEVAFKTMKAIESATSRQASMFLANLLSCIIKTESIRMARGGKGSRRLSAIAYRFIDRLGASLSLRISCNGGAA